MAIKIAMVVCAVGNFYFACKCDDEYRWIHIAAGTLATFLIFS